MVGRKLVLLLAVFVLIALPLTAFAADMEGQSAKQGPFEVGQTVKDVVLTSMDGESLDLGKVQKKSIIVFMNTACSACQQEMAEIQKLYLKNKDKVDYLAVSVDLNGEVNVPKFISTSRSKAQFYLDSSFEAAGKFGFSYTPATIIIDKGGQLLYKHGGWMKSGAKKILGDMQAVF